MKYDDSVKNLFLNALALVSESSDQYPNFLSAFRHAVGYAAELDDSAVFRVECKYSGLQFEPDFVLEFLSKL